MKLHELREPEGPSGAQAQGPGYRGGPGQDGGFGTKARARSGRGEVISRAASCPWSTACPSSGLSQSRRIEYAVVNGQAQPL